MKNILFLTAYSDHSKNIYQYALELAQQFGSTITLCHIYKGEEPPLEQKLSDQKEKLSAFAKENMITLDEMIPIKIKVGTGDFMDYILELEKTLEPDLIVMGMTRNKYSNKVFGSLSLQVLKRATTPVLLVPPGTKIESIENIVFATYLSSSDDEKAIRYLTGWSDAFSAKLDVLCICDKNNLESGKSKLAKLKEFVAEEDPDIPIRFQLKEGDAAKMIEEYREFTEADLLVLATHRTGFWARLFEPAMTEKIANETIIPLLVLKQ